MCVCIHRISRYIHIWGSVWLYTMIQLLLLSLLLTIKSICLKDLVSNKPSKTCGRDVEAFPATSAGFSPSGVCVCVCVAQIEVVYIGIQVSHSSKTGMVV